MPTNQFKPFATGGGANVLDPAAWAALAARSSGFVEGIADPQQVNTALRQANFVVATLAQLVSDVLQSDVNDDGVVANLEKQLSAALGIADFGTGGGTGSAYTATCAVPTLTLKDGLRRRFRATATNTGVATFSPDGLTAKPILAQNGLALVGGEVVNGGMTFLEYSLTADAWVLLHCSGGVVRGVTPASNDNSKALATTEFVRNYVPSIGGRLIGVQTFTSSATYTPTAGTNFVIVDVQGAGGGGGASQAITGTYAHSASGGGSGTYARVLIPSGFSGANVTVANGGASATAASATSFGSLVSCPGGRAGGSNWPSPVNGSTMFTSSLPVGITEPTVNSPAVTLASTRGRTGSVYGVSWNGTYTEGIAGTGGDSAFGVGGGGLSGTGVGNNATGYGAGGGGACSNNFIVGAHGGGAGGGGVVIVYEYA